MDFLQESDMSGPSDEARALQLQQYKATDAFYEVWSAVERRHGPNSLDTIRADPEYVAARTAYESTVTQLSQLLGSDAHCNHVDCDLWSLFSDCYKSDNNCRPRMHMTRAAVQAYFGHRS
jgi:hypothetical protein